MTKEVPRTLNSHPRTSQQCHPRFDFKNSFVVGRDINWLMTGRVGDDGSSEGVPSEERLGITEYFTGWAMRMCTQYGHVLVCRDDEGNGDVVGVLALMPPYRSRCIFTCHTMRPICTLGCPPSNPGLTSMLSAMEGGHQRAVGGFPHWYVAIVAVDPKAQGQGVGRRLVTAALALADGTPAYLECHDGNVAYYERFGFRVADRYMIEADAAEEPLPFNAMVHRGDRSDLESGESSVGGARAWPSSSSLSS